MNLEFSFLTKEDIDAVFEIEKNCFDDYWSRDMISAELSNPLSRYLVAKLNGKIIGFVGSWFILNECHINNVAIHSDFRGNSYSVAMLKKLIEICYEEDIDAMTLEVRKSNEIAINLYKKIGFVMAGIRKEYYSNNKEDAIIMWKNLLEKDTNIY
ncbi:MAG: ribosomal protein S18-alanine N-acetyltransferase [Clostridioides sp.]|nr:ribosomal protein S18-alanine N-acetyltransferase [Clostridioides sp.]